MSYVILDLEWNGSFSKSAQRYVNEIIEFGAVKTDSEFHIIDTFSVLISPQIGKKLSGRVKQLTKITNEELADSGIDFLSAAEAFSRFLGDATVMTWGTSDIHALIDNYRYYCDDYHIPFLSSYCDIQEYCERAMGKYDEGNQIGLGVCAEMLGVDFCEDDQHRADADAVLSLACVKKFADKIPVENYILKADCEAFYDRMMFKNYFITDLKSPRIDRAQLRFRCESCGKQARRSGKWKLHNKNFTSDFYCKHCDRKFTGRISFKQRFDGVKINKRIIVKAENKKKTEVAAVDKVNIGE